MESKSTNFLSMRNQKRQEERRLQKEKLEKLIKWAKKVAPKIGVDVDI